MSHTPCSFYLVGGVSRPLSCTAGGLHPWRGQELLLLLPWPHLRDAILAEEVLQEMSIAQLSLTEF